MLKKLTPYHYALLSKRLGEYSYRRQVNGPHPLREGEPVLDRWVGLLSLIHDDQPISSIGDLLSAAAQPSSWDFDQSDEEIFIRKDPMKFLIQRLYNSQHRIDWQAYVDFYHDLPPADQNKIETVFQALMGFGHAQFLSPKDPVWTVPEQMHDLSRASVTFLLNTEQRPQRIHEILKYRVMLHSYYYEIGDENGWEEAGENHLIGVAATLEGAIEIAAKGIQKFVLVRPVDELRPTARADEIISGISGSPYYLFISDWSDTTVSHEYTPLTANICEQVVHNAGNQYTFHLSLDWKMPFDEFELPAALAEIETLERSLSDGSTGADSLEAFQIQLENLRSRIPTPEDDSLLYKRTLIDTLATVAPNRRVVEHNHGL